MTTENIPVLVDLSQEEQEAVAALQQEMGLDDPSEVMRLLLRQAAQRAMVVCPSCGHSARKNSEDEASCTSCMSVMHLSDGIWQIIELRDV